MAMAALPSLRLPALPLTLSLSRHSFHPSASLTHLSPPVSFATRQYGGFHEGEIRKRRGWVVRCASAGSHGGIVEDEDPSLIGVHSQVWVGGWSRDECVAAVSQSAKLGYNLIEVSVGDPQSVDSAFTRSVLSEHGMAAATSLGLSFEADVSSPDPDIAAKGEELLLEALRVAKGIGARYLTGITYSALGKYPGPFVGGAGKDHLVRSLRRVAQQAADGGVILGLEVANRYETNVLNTAAQGMELLAEINHPNVIVHLDTYHMNIEESSLAGAIELCGNKLGYFHIGESHRGYLGTGNLDWQQVFRALAKSGYKGPITFESFSSQVVSTSLSNVLCVWRNLWEDSEDLANHAKSFINANWAAAKRGSM